MEKPKSKPKYELGNFESKIKIDPKVLKDLQKKELNF